jgi:hypothetical protein
MSGGRRRWSRWTRPPRRRRSAASPGRGRGRSRDAQREGPDARRGRRVIAGPFALPPTSSSSRPSSWWPSSWWPSSWQPLSYLQNWSETLANPPVDWKAGQPGPVGPGSGDDALTCGVEISEGDASGPRPATCIEGWTIRVGVGHARRHGARDRMMVMTRRARRVKGALRLGRCVGNDVSDDERGRSRRAGREARGNGVAGSSRSTHAVWCWGRVSKTTTC